MLRELNEEINRERFEDYLLGFSYSLFQSFKSTIRWPWGILHILGIVLSVPIILSGLDWNYFQFFKTHLWLQIFAFPAVMIGGIVPIIIPPLIYLFGKKENKPYLEPIAFALTQAAVVGVLWISLYKAITGRTGPELFEEIEGEYSMEFAFGFLRTGVFEGWPSAHTAIAWAMATVFFLYRPELSLDTEIVGDLPTFLKYRKYGFLYALYIGLGISTNIHWLSDAVAGMFVGITVGLGVNQTFQSFDWGRHKVEK